MNIFGTRLGRVEVAIEKHPTTAPMRFTKGRSPPHAAFTYREIVLDLGRFTVMVAVLQHEQPNSGSP